VVIPYDERVSGLERLCRQQRVQIMDSPTLGELDRLERLLWPGAVATGRLRKLAVFWGPLDRFFYLDADVVILGALEHLFCVFDDAEADVLYTDADLDWVFGPGPLREAMSAAGTPGFNTGAFAARRGLVTRDDVRSLVPELARHRSELATRGDQPLINYCCLRNGARLLRFSEASPGVAFSCWAGVEGVHRSPYCGSHVDDDGRWVPLLHWAGFDRRPEMPYAYIGLTGAVARAGVRTRIEHTPHGLGLVAATDLAAGDVVARFDGPAMPYAAVPEHEVVYVLQWGRDRFIVPQSEARFVNHGCEPNCTINGQLEIVTIAAVSAGEELTIDYVRITRANAGDAFWDERWTFECSCGSPQCLGLIDGPVIVDG